MNNELNMNKEQCEVVKNVAEERIMFGKETIITEECKEDGKIIKTTTVKREFEASGLLEIVAIITIGIVSLAFIMYLSSL